MDFPKLPTELETGGEAFQSGQIQMHTKVIVNFDTPLYNMFSVHVTQRRVLMVAVRPEGF